MESIDKVLIDLNKDTVSFYNFNKKDNLINLIDAVNIYGKNPASLDMMYIKIMTLNKTYNALCIEIVEDNLTYTVSIAPTEKNGITCVECLNSMVSSKFQIKFIDDNFISSIVYSQETSGMVVASLIVILINANKTHLSYSYKNIHVNTSTDYFSKYVSMSYPHIDLDNENANLSNTSRKVDRLKRTDTVRNRVSFSADQTKTSITETKLANEQRMINNIVHNKESRNINNTLVIPMFFPQKDIEKKVEWEQKKAFDKFNDQLYQQGRMIKEQENRFQNARSQKDFGVYSKMLSN